MAGAKRKIRRQAELRPLSAPFSRDRRQQPHRRRARNEGDFFLSNLAVNDKDPEANEGVKPADRSSADRTHLEEYWMRASNEGAERPVAALALSVFSVAFIVAALYHFFQLVHVFGDVQAVAFHGSFVLIDVFVAFAIWRRLPGLLFLVAILTAEQLYSHGSAAWYAWQEAHQIDVISWVVVIAMPLLLIFVVLDRASKHKANKTAISSA